MEGADAPKGPRWMPCGCGCRLDEYQVDGRSYGVADLQDLWTYLGGQSTNHDVVEGRSASKEATIVVEERCHEPHVREVGNGILMTTVPVDYQIARGRSGGRRKKSRENNQ